jgi:hypothetical protein
VSCCEHGSEPLSSGNDVETFDLLSDCQILHCFCFFVFGRWGGGFCDTIS